MKKSAIEKQKLNIQDLKGGEVIDNSVGIAIDNLNLMVDDLENNGDIIDKDNIHLYYKFMCQEDKNIHSGLIHKTLMLERQFEVFQQLGIDVNNESEWKKLQEKYIEKQNDNKRTKWVTDLKVFGVKDTLESISEYIKDIKASEQYKQYTFLSQNNVTSKNIECIYESIWDDCTNVETKAILNLLTGEIVIEDTNEDIGDLESLTDEKIWIKEKSFSIELDYDEIDKDSLMEINAYLSENLDLDISSPTIDECLQQIEEEEAAKQKNKSPSL